MYVLVGSKQFHRSKDGLKYRCSSNGFIMMSGWGLVPDFKLALMSEGHTVKYWKECRN